MTLRATAPGDWVRATTGVLEAPQAERFGPALLRALRPLVPSDRGFIYVFRRSSHPWLLFAENESEPSAADLARAYLGNGYLSDPYYRSFLRGLHEGVYTLGDLERDAIAAREPRGWEAAAHLTYLTPISRDSAIVLLLVRDPGPTRYEPDAVDALRALQPAIGSALRAHWEAQAGGGAVAGDALHEQVQRALERFGADRLTPRERAVIRLLLRGHSTRATGEKLGIATATAAIHRKRAYSKLGVSSQAELFDHFISSLGH